MQSVKENAENGKNETFTPKIVAFCCNWCSYAGADLAGSSRLSYPASVKIIRVPCSCRVNPTFVLKAFQQGADGGIAITLRETITPAAEWRCSFPSSITSVSSATE